MNLITIVILSEIIKFINFLMPGSINNKKILIMINNYNNFNNHNNNYNHYYNKINKFKRDYFKFKKNSIISKINSPV